MFIRSAFSFITLCALASVGVAACAATTGDASEEPASESQDAELRKSLTSCNVDSDCVAVPRGGCCDNGWKEAVNKHHTHAYANATKCTVSPPPFCPLYMVLDRRVAQCDTHAKQCKMIAVAEIDGSWGADQTIMTISGGHADLEFGCGTASFDAPTFTTPTTFTATGTHTRGTGVQPPPGMEPQPEPATFKGTIIGTKLTLEMTVSGSKSTLVFTKDRAINLMRCL
jgi:hypothetical protein